MRSWLAAVVVCAVLGTSLPASAQSELDTARQNAKEAAAAADAAREEASAAKERADALAADLDRALDLVLGAEADLEVVGARAERAREEKSALSESVADLMVQRYVFIERTADLARDAGPSEEVRANALAQFASYGFGDDIDRYRVVEDDLAAAETELRLLGIERELAVATLERNDAQLGIELEEVARQLDIAQEREAEFLREVGRLEEEERLRLEAERRAAAELRRQAEEQKRREAQAELDRQREAEAKRAAEEAAANPTTTTVPATTVPPETVPPETVPADAADGNTDTAADTASTETTPTETTGSETAAPADEAPVTEEQPAPDLRGSNGFLCPIGGPTSFFDTWGAARSGGRRHKGVDMFASRGTPVVAPVSGVVRHSSSSSLAGLAFYLDGDDGTTYFGAHLDSFGSSGRVEAGTVIGTVGNTGNARFSSPHLHFEIKPGGGSSVNPTPAVSAACG